MATGPACIWPTTWAPPTTVASLALTAFWGMVTVGRVLFALIERAFPNSGPTTCCRSWPRSLWRSSPSCRAARSVSAFSRLRLAGLGCSALLPLTIGFGQEELVAIAASVAGFLIAFYQMGYGIAAFGVGPLERFTGLDLRQIYGLVAVVALAMAALSFVVVSRRPTAEAPATAQLGEQRTG